jgi:hypothetical protein
MLALLEIRKLSNLALFGGLVSRLERGMDELCGERPRTPRVARLLQSRHKITKSYANRLAS